jgi:hypothetical protein
LRSHFVVDWALKEMFAQQDWLYPKALLSAATVLLDRMTLRSRQPKLNRELPTASRHRQRTAVGFLLRLRFAADSRLWEHQPHEGVSPIEPFSLTMPRMY